MKKILSIILCIMLVCVALSACGAKQTNSAPDPADYDFVIDAQYISDLTADYLKSESYLKGVADFEAQMGSKNGGALMEKAMEYHLADLNGCSIDAILLTIKTDIAYGEGCLADTALVCVDLNSGEIYDNITVNIDEFVNTFDGNVRSNDQLRALIMNTLFSSDPNTPILFHDRELKKALNADEIASVNEMLGLSYKGYENAQEADESVDEETGNPIISTDALDRIQKVTEMAMAFRDSSIYQEIALDPSSIQISAAMEYKNDNFASGYPVHILMIHTDGFDTALHGLSPGTMLMDMNSGKMYTVADFDFNKMPDINSFASVEDAYQWCITCYDNILNGSETQLWASAGETIVHLTEDELSTVNETLGAAYAAASSENDALRQEAAAGLTEQQKLFFDAAVEFSRTARYKETAKDPASIRLASASEYTFKHPDNGFELHALLLQADGIDTDMYGFSAAISLKDLDTGMVYTDTFMDLSNWTWDWEDYSDINNVYAACMLIYESVIINGGSNLIMEDNCDQLTHMSEADLQAVNAALNP